MIASHAFSLRSCQRECYYVADILEIWSEMHYLVLERGGGAIGPNMSFVESCSKSCNFIVELYVNDSITWQLGSGYFF